MEHFLYVLYSQCLYCTALHFIYCSLVPIATRPLADGVRMCTPLVARTTHPAPDGLRMHNPQIIWTMCLAPDGLRVRTPPIAGTMRPDPEGSPYLGLQCLPIMICSGHTAIIFSIGFKFVHFGLPLHPVIWIITIYFSGIGMVITCFSLPYILWYGMCMLHPY